MTTAQQEAVGELGDDEISWNEHFFEVCMFKSWYDNVNWVDLPLEIKEAAAILGYNQSLWDSGAETSITEQSWGELTKEQRDAVWELGWESYW